MLQPASCTSRASCCRTTECRVSDRLPCFTLVLPELIEVLERKLRVGVPVALLDDLRVEELPVAEVHLGERATRSRALIVQVPRKTGSRRTRYLAAVALFVAWYKFSQLATH